MPLTNLKSKWTTGGLVFYNSADMGSALHYLKLDIDATAITGEQHALDVDFTGVVSETADQMVAGNFVCTPTGTASDWCSAIYAKAVQTSKAVSGYICAAEFEVIHTGTWAASKYCILTLNANDKRTGSMQGGTAYIWLRDYGTVTMNTLFNFYDATIANNDEAALVSTLNADQAASHTIRCLVGATPVWILCTTTHG
jgi:hypothetical protein